MVSVELMEAIEELMLQMGCAHVMYKGNSQMNGCIKGMDW